MNQLIRQVIEDFLSMLYDERRVREAFERHVAESYIQHNPSAANGREASILFFEGFFAATAVQSSVERVIVQDDMAAVHMHIQLGDQTAGFAVMDMWRLENGKIVEHWDVIQEIPVKRIGGNSTF